MFAISAGVMIPASFVAPNLPKAFLPFLRKLSKEINGRPDNVQRTLLNLKKNRLVKIIQKGEETILTLSEHGKQRLLINKIDDIAISQPKKWDYKWRIIIFDIPESKKKAREALRKKLKQLNFYQLQKSCFIYPFECKNEIDFITELFEISQYVNYITAESIENDDVLQQYFNL